MSSGLLHQLHGIKRMANDASHEAAEGSAEKAAIPRQSATLVKRAGGLERKRGLGRGQVHGHIIEQDGTFLERSGCEAVI